MARLSYLLMMLMPMCVFAQPEWQGTYFGINLGAANIDVNPQTSTTYETGGYFQPSSPAAIQKAGDQHAEDWNFTTGVQLGYNWQWSRFVLGVELDGSYLPSTQSITSTAVYPCCSPLTFTIDTKTDTEWQATARPRLGYAFEQGPLFYITGGLGVAGVSSEFTFVDHAVEGSGSLNETVVGWVAGGGFEVLMSKSAIFRAEYLFSEYTTDQITSDNLGAENPLNVTLNPMFLEASYKVHMLRLGLNLKL